ncbi:MAG: autotransporter outer membrane beta-barrel domain-containing protein, partial [Rickettsiales bacterium]|nr:autotransporter outer membrane beta-barrel domain-containing protein [Rickettsiales bacterium]
EKEKGSKKRRGKESKKIEKEEESPEPEVRGEEGEKEEEREEGEKVEESDSQTTDEATREHRGYFISDVLDAFMLANSARPINIYSRIGNANKAGAIGFFTDLAYTNAKVDKTTNNVGGVQLGLIFPTEETKVVLGVGANFNRHSIAGEKENKANINSFGFGIYGGFNGDIFDFRTGLAINKNNFSIDRKITTLSEEYNGNYNSKFVGNTFSFDMEAGVKFKVANYLRLRPYVGLQTAILSIRDFSESGPSKDVRLKVNSRNYHLTMGRLGIDLVSAYDTSSPIDFHLGIGGKFKIPSKPMALSATLENETIKNEGTKDLKYLFGVDAGVGYRIGKNMTLGGNVGYYGSKSTVRSVDAKVLFKIDL